MMKPAHLVARVCFLVYGLAAYAAFLVTLLYAIGWVGNFWSVLGWEGAWFRSMDVGQTAPFWKALLVDVLLLGLFAVQHSVMARAGFKRVWTRVVPPAIERSTFVLAASLCLALLFWQWRPLGMVLWDVSDSALGQLLVGVSLVGWFVVVLSTFMLDHFELFGLRQVGRAFLDRPHRGVPFGTPGLYRAVRHPIYLGFIVAFWATPVMTVGHLVFALATTAYILIAIQLEERDLIAHYGEAYRAYRRRVRMLLPLPKRDGATRSETPHSHKPV